MCIKKTLLELAGSARAWRVRWRCIDSLKVFRILLDKTTANMYFLAPFYSNYISGELIHCLEISGNKNNLRTNWGWNRQNNKNSPFSAESYWFLYKKEECMRYFISCMGYFISCMGYFISCMGYFISYTRSFISCMVYVKEFSGINLVVEN